MLQTAFTRQKDFGKEVREAQWAHAQRTLHGLHPPESKGGPAIGASTSNRELGDMAEQAKRRAEIARYEPLLRAMSQIRACATPTTASTCRFSSEL